MLPGLLCVLGLAASNVFMTIAWYGHLKHLDGRPWLVAALLSWGIALFEYLFQVPANRVGYQVFTLPQLKILQEVISLLVFVPVSVWLLGERPNWNYAGAAVCLVGAVFFIFRGGKAG